MLYPERTTTADRKAHPVSVTFTAATRSFRPEFNVDVLTDIPAAEELSVNMSNSNAARVCGSLGIDLDKLGWCGSMPAEDFLGRVLVALAIEPADEGVPSHRLLPGDSAGIFGTVQEGGPAFIECGRREGYTQERLGQLRELADWAVANGAEIAFS